MSNTFRLVFAMVSAALLAVLAAPEFSALAAKYVPPGTGPLLALALAAALHKMNDKAQPSPDAPPDGGAQ